MNLLTTIKNKLSAIKNLLVKIETSKLYEELDNRKDELRRENVVKTLNTMANYLVIDQLERTGILYRIDDKYIQTKAQHLFWEWKNEGIINEFDDFEDATKAWISVYSI